jgi:hypothetical protein
MQKISIIRLLRTFGSTRFAGYRNAQQGISIQFCAKAQQTARSLLRFWKNALKSVFFFRSNS